VLLRQLLVSKVVIHNFLRPELPSKIFIPLSNLFQAFKHIDSFMTSVTVLDSLQKKETQTGGGRR
jgi:hypothetical protein